MGLLFLINLGVGCYNLERVEHERKIPCNRAQMEGFFFNSGKANGKR